MRAPKHNIGSSMLLSIVNRALKDEQEKSKKLSDSSDDKPKDKQNTYNFEVDSDKITALLNDIERRSLKKRKAQWKTR